MLPVLDTKQANPLFAIWIRPRSTVLRLVRTKNLRPVLTLAVIWGVSTSLYNRMRGVSFPLSPIATVPEYVIWGCVCGIVGLYITAAFMKLGGSLLGGTANAVDVRVAIAWSHVPDITWLLAWSAALIVTRQDPVGISFERLMIDSPAHAALWAAVLLVRLFLGVWSMVIGIAGLAAVMNMTVVRSVITYFGAHLAYALLAFGAIYIATNAGWTGF